MLKTNALLTTLFIALLISACKKEPIDNNGNDIYALNVLNENAAFETLYDSAHIKNELQGGLYGSIGIEDFEVENNNTLHLIYYATQPSQGGEYKNYFRFSVDINSKSEITLPLGSNVYNPIPNWGEPKYQYFPNSNILTSVQFSGGNGSIYSYMAATDVYLEFQTTGFLGTQDLAYRHFVTNHSGTNYGTFSKITNGTNGIGANYQMFFSINKGNAIGISNVYTDASSNDLNYAISITKDSVLVDKLSYTSFGNGNVNPVFTETRENQIAQTAEVLYWNTGIIYSLRQYAPDGKSMSFALIDRISNTANTYTYNFENNTLQQILSNATLDYFGTGSDLALDENGIVYYSGYAANGSNTNGVSVYKKTNAAQSQLVGSDDFLVSGKIVKLKCLNGKVYMAVTADQTDPEAKIHQISIIRQN